MFTVVHKTSKRHYLLHLHNSHCNYHYFSDTEIAFKNCGDTKVSDKQLAEIKNTVRIFDGGF